MHGPSLENFGLVARSRSDAIIVLSAARRSRLSATSGRTAVDSEKKELARPTIIWDILIVRDEFFNNLAKTIAREPAGEATECLKKTARRRVNVNGAG
jgi:hypothetical protein